MQVDEVGGENASNVGLVAQHRRIPVGVVSVEVGTYDNVGEVGTRNCGR